MLILKLSSSLFFMLNITYMYHAANSYLCFSSLFKKQLKFVHKVHQNIASKNNVSDTFQKEWSQYQLLINDII